MILGSFSLDGFVSDSRVSSFWMDLSDSRLIQFGWI